MDDIDEMDEVIGEFLVESHENLDRLDADLVALEQTPDDVARLASVFRTLHTIKGTCGFLGFDDLERVAHAAESLLAKLRDRALDLTPERTTALLATVDVVRGLLAQIEQTGSDGGGDHRSLIAELEALQSAEQSASMLGKVLVEQAAVEPAAVEAAIAAQATGDPRMLGQILVEQGAADASDVAEALKAQGEIRHGAAPDATIRVDVELLDRLMNLVGELVLARNQIVQHTVTSDAGSTLVSTCQRLDLITTELQEGVMKTRMQPIGTVWSKLPRVVRDIAVVCGKHARVEMEGQETELDKTILEAIKDPLTHMVRNSVDHGLESTDARIAAGKPAEGTLSLRAFHEGGQVNIEISDDGKGLALDRIRSRALERGLITADQASRMADRDVGELIFLPGFSTAEVVSNISGRGVGMDVVRSNIERIGGTVEVTTIAGRSTTFRVRIPLTLAIIPALTVSTSGQRFAIPQVNLQELVRIEGRQIEHIGTTPLYRLRGNLLPVLDLAEQLALANGGSSLGEREVVNIVVVRAGDRSFGLVVDVVNDTEEIVVKPLGSELKGLAAFAGATIMGDGQVALILDVPGLAHLANLSAEGHPAMLADDADQVESLPTTAMLVVAAGAGSRVALPLAAVNRLEDFDVACLERGGGREVVQYRGAILPLVRLDAALGLPSTSSSAPAGPVHVVVHDRDGETIGLVVDTVLDIVEEHVVLAPALRRRGLLGSAVLQGLVTDIVDLDAVFADA